MTNPTIRDKLRVLFSRMAYNPIEPINPTLRTRVVKYYVYGVVIDDDTKAVALRGRTKDSRITTKFIPRGQPIYLDYDPSGYPPAEDSIFEIVD